jgi:phosphoribosylformylglycinamidine synthase
MHRAYVEKKDGFNLEALDILNEVKTFLKIGATKSVRVLTRYDVEGLDDTQFETALREVFSQNVTENVYCEDYAFDTEDCRVLAIESLPGQYDQRSDFAARCASLVIGAEVIVRCGRILLFYGDFTDEQFEMIKSYLINPTESIEASLDMPKTLKADYKEVNTVETLNGFCELDCGELAVLLKKQSINMDIDDALFCQDYFKKENREPTITELRIFDTYWSDHCRHSTFMTIIDSVEIEDSVYASVIKDTIARYYDAKDKIGDTSPHCLMNIAVMGMKKMRYDGLLSDMEISDEVNACSIEVDVTVDGNLEKWLLMFKNETHNHPTEIEPFGGAATCIGGGIRDPLSGRAYVYGAIRLTGSGDPRTAYADTLQGKLPQRKITKAAAEGYSSYANQIGLASGHLSEIYDEGFTAKRMECGALVAGVRKEDVTRLPPQKGDVIMLIGGETGRDGCGGATGSSKEHDESSLEKGGAEVQKGNPVIERNIVRLFRNPKVSKMIKKCNDFGAGGVSVAICEMAKSLVIDLDKVPLKYGGLDGTEIAISESQERMACLLSAKDMYTFIAMADKENLQCVKVAEVTDDGRMVMWWKGNKIADISAEMLNSGGVRKHANIKIAAPKSSELNVVANGISDNNTLAENWLANIADLNVCSKIGITDRFDATSAGGTVFMPFGGKYQKTPEQGLCMKFPVRLGECDTASVMTLGYNPKLGYFSPFHQAVYAVLESVIKLGAMGGDTSKARLTFQEYYESLGADATRWGKPYAALMGAFLAQDELGAPSIGGKDSMSGTFMDIDVPPSLISFAVSTADVSEVVSSAFKKNGSRVIKIYAEISDDLMPDWEQVRSNLNNLRRLIKNGAVRASASVGFGGVAAAISKMCFGNKLGFTFAERFDNVLLYTPDYTAVILEIADTADLSGLKYFDLGFVNDLNAIVVGDETIDLDDVQKAWEGTLEEVFSSEPLVMGQPNERSLTIDCERSKEYKEKRIQTPSSVVIPIFPGSNGEYELEDWFIKSGATVNAIVFRNRTLEQQETSINELAEAINSADIFAIPSGMSAGCDSGGSAKFIAAALKREPVKQAIESLVERKGLILGIGEGFNALVKTGLLPHGRFSDETNIAIERNTPNKYICRMVNVRTASVKSPWLNGCDVGDIFTVPFSAQEGRVVVDANTFKELCSKGQIATQYVNFNGSPSMDSEFNPSGASFAIESMTSHDGRIMGRMCSFERLGSKLYKNIPNYISFDRSQQPKEECGIIGIYDENNLDTANLAYFGLMALQHRGQESAGIAISNTGFITSYRDSGLVQEVFDSKILSILKGDMCLGHVKYSSSGSEKRNIYAQPFISEYKKGQMAIALNGAITNASEWRERLSWEGVEFSGDSDCEVIGALIADKFRTDIVSAVKDAVIELEGAFSLGILADNKLIAVRDRNGVRPLCIGEFINGRGYVFSSENVAFDIVGAEFIYELERGQMAVIDYKGLDIIEFAGSEKGALCSFEFVYFARPDSNINGISVYKSRERAGRQLAIEYPVEADCVIGIPDSGTPGAIGYAAQSGIPYAIGLIKNRYIGRSFIEPTQRLRELSVKLKLNPIRDIVQGKRVVLIDDSIFRGTTTFKTIELLKIAGAAEVHLRILAPQVKGLCRFGGIDIRDKADLISNRYSAKEICKKIGADSLGFLSRDGLMKALSGGTSGYCSECLFDE